MYCKSINDFGYQPFTFFYFWRFDSSVGGFIFSKQFLQIATKLPTRNIYGFGENSHDSFKHKMDFTSWGMFARDNGLSGYNENNYGHHPFYMGVEDDGRSHGVLLLNRYL